VHEAPYERGALADFDEIFAYIAADDREAASRLVARIENVAATLSASQLMGRETCRSGFLRFPVGNYLIVYEIVDDEVVVLYVRHSARPRPWGRGIVRSHTPLIGNWSTPL
jgi:toxin ParE1/3/4